MSSLRILKAGCLALICLLAAVPATGLALSQDQLDIFNSGINYYDVSPGTNCSSSATTTVPSGTLPSLIPEPYNGAFTLGADNHNVAPSLVAAIFSEEHNLGGSETSPDTSSLPLAWASFVKNHPDPNSGWATSGSGAEGPFQFLPSTWTGLGYDISQINDLVVAADAAAKDLANNGATIGASLGALRGAIFNYNHANWYVDAVITYYNYYNSQPASAPGGGSTTIVSSGCAIVDCSGSAPAGLSQVRSSAVCLAQEELQKWASGQVDPATGFLTYSQGVYEEWCADFVGWLYEQSGYPLQPNPNWRVSSVLTIQQIGQQNLSFHFHPSDGSYVPRPGDMAIHGTGHVNLVVAVKGTQITLIGGDEGQGPYGTQNPPSRSIVQEDVANNYSDLGITGYVSPD